MSESERLESCIEGLRKDQQNGYHGDCMSVEDREMVISALEELQEYQEIGTVEECREARERQRAKKPILSAPCKSINYYLCPNCKKILNINKPFCCDCGIKIDWSDNDD